MNEHYESQVLDRPAPTMENPSELPEIPQDDKAQEQPKEQGKPRVTEEDAIKRAMEKAEKAAKEKEPEKVENDKPKVEAKPEEKVKAEPDEAKGKVVEKPATEDQPKGETGAVDSAKGTGQDGEDSRQSEGRKFHEPPARFLPKAKEVWSNVPNAVKAEISRMSQEHENDIGQYKESRQFHDELREYDGMAKQAGTSIKQALDRYVGIDKQLNDPNPLKRAQTVLSLMQQSGVDPVAFAREIMKNPQQFQGGSRPDPALQRQMSQTTTETQSLKQELQSVKQMLAAQQYESTLFSDFRKDHPLFDENRQSIAKVLGSGIIEQLHGSGLSDRDRLEIAYSMAVPGVRAAASTKEPEFPASELPDEQLQDNVAGKKSITGAANGINTERRRKKTPDEAIQAAFEKHGL